MLQIPSWLAGPRLQMVNLVVFFTVIVATVDYPNPLPYVALAVALSGGLDLVVSRARYGGWRVPWSSLIGSLGIFLMVDGSQLLPFLLLPVLMVGSKHLIRWDEEHLFNPNNFAACVLLLVGLVRVGVNDWGAAPQSVGLMLLFGSISTYRAKRLDLAVAYLAFSWIAYWIVAQFQGWGLATVWQFSFAPLQILVGFFAITDPATSPSGRLAKVLWGLVIALIGVPATLAGHPEAPLFALLAAAPQRRLVSRLARDVKELVSSRRRPPRAVAGGEGG